jgi:hypothetical protein
MMFVEKQIPHPPSRVRDVNGNIVARTIRHCT